MINFLSIIALQTFIPMPDTEVIQNYTAPLGGGVDLQCPIQPGALQQHYSVIWTKDDVEIADSQSIGRLEMRVTLVQATSVEYLLLIQSLIPNNNCSITHNCLLVCSFNFTESQGK